MYVNCIYIYTYIYNILEHLYAARWLTSCCLDEGLSEVLHYYVFRVKHKTCNTHIV